jgi:hypothetical protein
MTNAQEYAAGTDPNDCTSALRVTGIQAGTVNGNDMVVSFPSVAGKSYRVDYCDTSQQDLVAPF